jgi:hypothetical protein
MDTTSLAFELLLRAIHDIEYSIPGPTLNMEARYVGDPQRYLAGPPPKDTPFTTTGVRDPALGNTGPLSYAEIEALVVYATPRHDGSMLTEYGNKFVAVARRVAAIEGIRITKSSIFLGRGAA